MDFILQARSLKAHDIQRAAAEIMSLNPWGGVCGVVCPDTLCMAKCVRKDIDRPVDIPAVQATIIQKARDMGVFPEWDPLEKAPSVRYQE